jgi:hypothetical protein
MSLYIKPECAPFYYKDGKKHNRNKTEKVKGYATNANGFALPCCWCDSVAFRPDFARYGFFDSDLHMDNVDTIEDIMISPAWQDWLNDITHNPNNAPRVCQVKCGFGRDQKEQDEELEKLHDGFRQNV